MKACYKWLSIPRDVNPVRCVIATRPTLPNDCAVMQVIDSRPRNFEKKTVPRAGDPVKVLPGVGDATRTKLLDVRGSAQKAGITCFDPFDIKPILTGKVLCKARGGGCM